MDYHSTLELRRNVELIEIWSISLPVLADYTYRNAVNLVDRSGAAGRGTEITERFVACAVLLEIE